MKIAIIPARGGSKGLPRKNVLEIMGKPLISYTIEAAIRSNQFDDIYVTSEDKEILNIATNYKEVNVIQRPESLSTDKSSSLAVINHVLKNLNIKKGDFCLLQPTSPLRSKEHIRKAFFQYSTSEKKSLVSVSEVNYHPYKMLVRKNEKYSPIINYEMLTSSRQELPEVVMPNGAIYICNIDLYLKERSLFYNETVYYKMDKISSIDIDDIYDFEKVKLILEKNENIYY